MSSPEKIDALAKILQTHPDEKERARAVTELGAMRNGPAYEALGIAMHDHSPVVRKAVVKAFEEVGADWVLAPVLIRLRSNDAGARMVACRELGRLGDQEAVLPLIDRLNDSNLQVRIAASFALGQLGDRRAITPLQLLRRRDWNPSLRHTIDRALFQLRQQY
ncbi:MAG: HEAT repeat domain-containing protein [Promethearchaeota archaeon]